MPNYKLEYLYSECEKIRNPAQKAQAYQTTKEYNDLTSEREKLERYKNDYSSFIYNFAKGLTTICDGFRTLTVVTSIILLFFGLWPISLGLVGANIGCTFLARACSDPYDNATQRLSELDETIAEKEGSIDELLQRIENIGDEGHPFQNYSSVGLRLFQRAPVVDGSVNTNNVTFNPLASG